MPSLDEIKAEIERLGGMRALLARPEVGELPRILRPHERIEAVVHGFRDQQHAGLLLATSERVLFVDKGFLYGLHVEDFPYALLNAVRFDAGLVYATLVLDSLGAEVVVNGVPADQAQAFCARVRALLTARENGDARESPEPAPTAFADGGFRLEPPGALPSFADVGGMGALKRELKESVGLMLAFPEKAEAYGVCWNGILLHGRAGVGKTFIARSLAGEFGLMLLQLSAADLQSGVRGESAQNVARAFRAAARNVPCVLFFDDFDAVAQRRGGAPDPEGDRLVAELLARLEEYRVVRELIVVAATDDLDALDPAVVRPGLFDRHVRIDLPDGEARRAIFETALEGRPVDPSVDLDDLARRSEGLTPAAIIQAVDAASLALLREAAETAAPLPLTTKALAAALDARGGSDRPTVEGWSWDRLVLPDPVKAELQALELLLRDPERARAFGIEPPTGVLLVGPPGTGKTTIAKVLAAQARCSFYPVSAADLTSKWAGESEQRVKRLFDRARENAPSIVFLDELDALGAERGHADAAGYDRQLNQLLQEMDGIAGHRGVLVLAATNRPDRLDPALRRGGRLSRTLEIPLPDLGARRALLELLTERMPLRGVDLDALARRTQGLSGADVGAVCQQAAMVALVRSGGTAEAPAVEGADFEQAVEDIRSSKEAA